MHIEKHAVRECSKSSTILRKVGWMLETLSLGIGIHLIFRTQNRNQLKKLESESIYLFDWNLIMAWNRNQFHVFALESESISIFAPESESYWPLGESVLSPIGNVFGDEFLYGLSNVYANQND